MKRLNILATAAALALGAHGAWAARDTYTATRVDHVHGEHFFEGLAMNDDAALVGHVALPDYMDWVTGPQGRTAAFQPGRG